MISWNYNEETAKTVLKPWGKEIWINYRDGENIGDEKKPYVMKKLYIKKEHVELVDEMFEFPKGKNDDLLDWFMV